MVTPGERFLNLGYGANGQAMRSDKDAIEALKQKVYPTLFAKHEGYHSIAHLLSDLL